MKVAIRMETPSLEASFLAEMFRKTDEVTVLGPESVDSHTKVYDLAVCVGPVRLKPLAKKSILFVMGLTSGHPDLGYDAVIVTTNLSKRLAIHQFGLQTRVFKAVPPVLGLEHGARRLQNEQKMYLTGWDGLAGKCLENHYLCRMWSRQNPYDLFSALDFNSRVRAGAVGWYNYGIDGYDLQVRRHLALGGRVFCPKDKEVLGGLADIVDVPASWSEPPSLDNLGRISPVGAAVGRTEDYVAAVGEILKFLDRKWRL